MWFDELSWVAFLVCLVTPFGPSGKALLPLPFGETWKAQALKSYVQNVEEQMQSRNMKL